MIIGTKANDTLTLTSSPATIVGLAGSDSLTTTVAGALSLTNTHDGGAGFDTLTADLSAIDTANTVTVSNAQSGGYGSDTISATLYALGASTSAPTGASQTAATSLITDKGGAGSINVSVTAFNSSPGGGLRADATSIVETGAGGDVIVSYVAAENLATNVISSGGGNDTITAEANLAVYSSGNAVNNVSSGSGNDLVAVTSERLTSYTARGADFFVNAGGGNDTVTASIVVQGGYGGSERIEILGGGNNDSLSADINVSTLNFSQAAVVLMNGGSGSDTVESDVLLTGARATGAVTLLGEGGNDVLSANSDVNGRPAIGAGVVDHVLDGGAGSDVISSTIDVYGAYGYGGNIRGSADLTGGFGADSLTSNITASGWSYSFPQSDQHIDVQNTLTGDGGNDTLKAFSEITLSSGPYSASGTITHTLSGGSSGDLLRSEISGGLAGVHNLDGGIGNDVIGAIGGTEATILGGNGFDTITSSATDNVIDGGLGGDVIDVDGSGVHVLSGGDDGDSFHVDLGSDNGLITITDWDSLEDSLCFEGVTDGDVVANGSIVDEVNGQIVGAGTNLTDYWLDFASGTRLVFEAYTPAGVSTDIASYAMDDALQILACADIADPIL